MTRKLTDKFPHLETPLVWLDFWSYTERLFLKGDAAPWLDPSEFDAYYRQALGLLDPAIAPIDLDRVIDAYLARNPQMRDKMTHRARSSYPLKTLLGEPGLRAAVAALCNVTRDARRTRPLALTVSAPLKLLNRAHDFAYGEPVGTIGEDDSERAAVYLTDFLGSLGQPQGLFVMILDPDGEAADANFNWSLNPLANLCKHMRWHLAMATAAALDDGKGADLVFTPGGLDGVWSAEGLAARSGAQALYATIPADADPEATLAQLRELRAVKEDA